MSEAPDWIISKKPCNSHFRKFCDDQEGVGFGRSLGPVSAIPLSVIRKIMHAQGETAQGECHQEREMMTKPSVNVDRCRHVCVCVRVGVGMNA